MAELTKDAASGVLYRAWVSPEAEAVFCCVHGIGGHSNRWEAFAGFCMRAKFSCYALELSGFGATDELPRGHMKPFAQYYKDVLVLHDIIRKECPGKKIFLMGESMGALIVLGIASSRLCDMFDGVVCSAPALGLRVRLSFVKRCMAALAGVLQPTRKISVPFDASMLTRDESMRSELNANPLEYRFITAYTARIFFAEQARLSSSPMRLTIPVLFLLPGEDMIIDSAVSQNVYSAIDARDKAVITYPGMYHALTIDADRLTVFRDIHAWVTQRLSRSAA